MSENKKRLQKVIGELIDTKQDKTEYLAGQLGIYLAGKEVVKVASQPGYVYVRLAGNHSEVIRAINGVVAEIFDLKVWITLSDTNPGVYVVVGRDLEQYGTWPSNTAYLPSHGASHSFGSGSDPVFIYKKQMTQPLQAHPTAIRSNKLYVEPDFYIWKGITQYFAGGYTPNLTVANPPSRTTARWLTVYLAGDTNSIGIVTGSLFSLFPFTATGSVYYIPNISPMVGLPLAAVLLTNSGTILDWGDIRDIRNFLDGGGTNALMHPLDPIGGSHTGTLRASIVTIVDIADHYTGTTVESALDEIWYRTTGSSGGSSLASGISIIDVGDYYTGTNVEQALQEIGLRAYGHNHGATRASIISGTKNIPLLDYVHTLEFVSFQGFILDPLQYSLSTGTDYLILNNSVNTNGIITVNYVIRGVA